MLNRIALARALAAVVAAACAGVVVPTAPAAADACTSGRGVTVVVDFNQLGGGARTACETGGDGETATRLFADAGFDLTYVQRQPSFVCQVAGEPADDPCVNTPSADAYWSLWWSDGSSDWVYATTNADALTVPPGGYVAFSWQQGSESRPPDVPVGGDVSGAEGPPSTPRPDTGSTAAADEDGLPTWVAPTVVGALFAAAVAAVLVRRRRGSVAP